MPEEFTLDHVVIAVRDLESATADYSELLGRDPSWRGSHPKWGTANTLFRIDNTYIELLARAGGKTKDTRWSGELSRFLEGGEGVYALALGTSDLKASVKGLRNRGIPVDDPSDGEGIDEMTGATRRWRNATVPLTSTNGTRIFFIEHKSPPEALAPAPKIPHIGGHVVRMDHAVVLSADMEVSKTLWGQQVGARLALDRTFPDRNVRILFFRLGDITVEVSGGAQQTEEGMGKPDRLWGLAWGVDDVTDACKRLRMAGVEVSEPRRGIKPGTLVATAKGRHTHGVATLLIEHTPESFTADARAPQNEAYDSEPGRRAFTVTGLDSVVLAVEDIEEAARTWSSTLALEAAAPIDPPNELVRLARIDAGNAGVVLAEAASPEHRIARAIAERGPGMSSIAIEVDDVDAAVRDLRAKGVAVSDVEYGAWPGTRVAHIEAAAANGVPIALVQRLPDVL